MKIKSLLCGAVLAVLMIGNVYAADLIYASSPVLTTITYGGPYIGFEAGITQQDGVTGFVDPPANTTGGTTDDSTGWNGGIKAGYAFKPFGIFSPRIEAEFVHLENEGSNINTFNAGGPTGSFAANTEIDANIGLVSLLFDFPLQGFGFTPFIGGSFGYGQVDVQASTGPLSIIDASDNVFAWALTGGLSYDISHNVTVDLSYRFLRLQDVSVAGPFAGGTLPAVNEDIDSHQVNLGIRVHI